MSFRSPAHWYRQYSSSVLLRQDLHAEAIAKVWDCFENAASKNVGIPENLLVRVYPARISYSQIVQKD